MEKYTLTTEELSRALQEALGDGGCFPLGITGRSMRPFLCHGRDIVWLRSFHPEACKPGAILLFRRQNGQFVLHRVRKCLPGGYRMNGDAQAWCEDIKADQVVAEAYQIQRKGKTRSCGCLGWKIRDCLWFPTRPIRPFLFRVSHYLRRIITH